MPLAKILVQLDGDSQASVFDSVVAIDSEADHLLRHHDVRPEQVRGLVHGAMFTRGSHDLHSTAVFIGGSDVALGERLLEEVVGSFFGPLRVSVMMDANGANTTAAAAVLAARRHVNLSTSQALVLGGTGPVGQRVARLLAGAGGQVRLASRSLPRAEAACDALRQRQLPGEVAPVAVGDGPQLAAALEDVQIVIAAGAAGVELLPAETRHGAKGLQVAIDLNAVPPLGLAGVPVMARAEEQEGVIVYGAIGVGGDKMKIHKAAVRSLFESNDQVLDAEEIYQLGQRVLKPT